MKKRYILVTATVLLVFLLSLILPACATQEPAPTPTPAPTTEEKPVVWRFSNVFPETDASSITAKEFMKRVTERTEGLITFDDYYGCALGAMLEHPDFVETGAVDMALYTRWYVPGKLPMSNFQYCFPFNLDDPSDCVKVSRQIYEEFPAFRQELAGINQMILIHLSNGEFEFLMKKPIRTLEDLKGQRIMMFGRFMDDWIAASGAVGIEGTGGIFYEMLQSGVADGARTTVSFLRSFKVHEQAPYFPVMRQGTVNCISIMVNLDTFNALSPRLQQIVLDTALEVEAMGGDIVKAQEEEVYESWREYGVTFIEFPDEEKVKWINLMPDTPAELAREYEEKGLPGWAVVDRYLELAEELGHKWPRKWAQR